MPTTLLDSHARRLAQITSLVGLWIFITFNVFGQSVAQPLTFLSPQQQPAPFLGVPYYGSERVNAYFDHDFPTYWVNGTIEIYNGWTATNANICDINAYRHVSSGTCLYYDGHPAYDFDLDYKPVLAAADGTVIRAGWFNWNNRGADLGLRLYIMHANGYETRYGHLSAIAVLTNTQVHRGQIIGTSGNTGNSTARHLHFELRLNDTPIDPFGSGGEPWLWIEGAWGGTWANHLWGSQSIPRYGAALVVDDDNPQQVGDPNDDPNFTKGCTGGYDPPNNCVYWTRATGVGINEDMLWTYGNDSLADYFAWWRPSQPGLYDVQVHVPRLNATMWWARYWLVSTYNYMPSIYTVVDQAGINDRWISLGIHQFGTWPSAPWYAIWVSDATLENPSRDTHCGTGWCQLGVDAVRFRPVWPVYVPVMLKNY